MNACMGLTNSTTDLNASRLENQWNACAIKITSTEESSKGMDWAVPSCYN
jgi:hypothetical protein